MRKKNTQAATPPNVVEIPGPGDFRRLFAQSAMRHNFSLTLTGPMMEMLCAIADGVARDREYHWAFSSVTPANFVGQVEHLIKRGLVFHVPRALQPVVTGQQWVQQISEGICEAYKLTPIGEAFVAMLKTAGLFVKADAAIDRETRSKKR